MGRSREGIREKRASVTRKSVKIGELPANCDTQRKETEIMIKFLSLSLVF